MPDQRDTVTGVFPERAPATGLAIALTVASALLFVACFQPHSYRLLVWVSLVPFIVALEAGTTRRAALLGALWGMIAAYGITDWLPRAVATYYEQPVWLGATLFGSAAFSMGGVYYMAFAAFYRFVVVRGVRSLPLVAAAAWVAAELGRGRVLTGNPWGLLGYTQAGYDPLAADGPWHYASTEILQIASLAGVYGISFLIIAVNVAVARLVLTARQPDRRRFAIIDAAAVTIIVTAALSYGSWRLPTASDAGQPGVEVAIVQANLDLGAQWDESLYGANLETYLRLTHEALQQGRTDLVVWPEAAMTFFVDAEPHYRAAIARIISRTDTELLAGAPRFDEDDTVTYFNSAFVLKPDGEIAGHYDKEHLLPFSEYFPFGSIAYLRRSFARVREFTPGTHTAPLDTVAGAAGIVICNEAMFPRIARRRVRAGADYFVNLSNDTWVGDVEFAEHQFDIAAMRAVEFGRYLVRASTSGPSGIVDSFGRVVKRTPAYQAGFVRGRISRSPVDTHYARIGDAFAWLCVGWVVALIGRNRKKSSRTS